MVYNPDLGMSTFRGRVPRNMASQLGSSLDTFYGSTFSAFSGRVDTAKMREFERAALTDPTVSCGVEFLILSILSCIGPYTHPNPKVRDFVDEAFIRIAGSLKLVLSDHLYSRIVGGFGLGEKMLSVADNRLWLKSIIHYQPRTIRFYPNEKGQLTDNEPSIYSPYQRSGIYQDRPNDMPVRLPQNKVFYTANKPRYGNYYGVSKILPVYRHFRIKEAVMEMNNIALDRYGTPIPVILVPPGTTGERRPDPNNSNGYVEVTNRQAAEEAVANISTGYGLVLTNTEENNKVAVSMLGTQNNYGSAFLDSLAYHNREIFRGLLIPQLLLQENSSNQLGAGSASTVHFEVYKLMLRQIVDEVLDGLLDQVVQPLIYANFGVEDPGGFVVTAFDPESAKLLAETHGMLIDRGFISPQLDKDLDHVRGIQGLPALDAKEKKTLQKHAATWWENKGAPDPAAKQATAGRPSFT